MTDLETTIFNQTLTVYNSIFYRPGNEQLSPEEAMELAKNVINQAITFAKLTVSGE